jgi:hypothetical protein
MTSARFDLRHNSGDYLNRSRTADLLLGTQNDTLVFVQRKA